MGKNFEINVMMFGGRRSGKTSILAAMKECVDQVFRDEQELGLSISSLDFDTMKALEEKNQELHLYYSEKDRDEAFTPDNNPTQSQRVYQFGIQLVNKPSAKLQMNFTDYPGEWLDNSSKFEQLKEIMEKTDIIMIAIDTPYLMEEARTVDAIGRYNEPKNFTGRIADMVKENFVVPEGSIRKKMILFVPLKCEKYYNQRNLSEDRMEELNVKVKKAYEKLITFITQGENKDRYECAIAPIFTLGNARFNRFAGNDTNASDGSNNYYIMNAKGYPDKPLYSFDIDATEPAPEYCDQPLLYTLVFLLKWAEQTKTRKPGLLGSILGMADTMASRFLKIPGAKDFADRSEFLRSKLKKEGDGYEIICDPLKFKGV